MKTNRTKQRINFEIKQAIHERYRSAILRFEIQKHDKQANEIEQKEMNNFKR